MKDALKGASVLRPIHLYHVHLVFKDATKLTKAYDWSKKSVFLLKDEVERLEKRLQIEDPDSKITQQAEVDQAEQQRHFGKLNEEIAFSRLLRIGGHGVDGV